MQHESFLTYRNFRHLKISVLGLLVAILVYVAYEPLGGRNGGTVVGFVLGAVAAALIVWLVWFGVRKRSYLSSGAPLQGWLSAHVYLGFSLLLLVPLHSGFEFNGNWHTLAYVLMSLVVMSGVGGVFLYAAVPSRMTDNRPGEKLDALIQNIADADAEARSLGGALPDVFAGAVQTAVEGTRIGGGVLRRLSGVDPDCGTTRALEVIHEAMRPPHETISAEARERVDQLVGVLSVKRILLARVRRDVRYKTFLELWLWFHVPLSFATIVLVTAHVIAVFYYW